MAKMIPQTSQVGQSLLTVTGSQRGAAVDLNARTQYTDAIGFINQVGNWRIMEQTNSAVAVGNRSLLGVLQGAKWSVVAHTEANEKIVDAVRQALFERMDRRFETVVKTFFRAPGYGFAPHEITTHQADGITWFKDFGYRPPNTIDLSTVKLGKNGWYDATQKFYDSENNLKVVQYGQPGEEGKGWLLWVTFGDNGTPFGEAFYRPIWPIHERRRIAMQLEPIALQKAALGVPVVFLKEGIDPNSNDGPVSKEDYQKTLEEIGDVTAHEQGVVGIPSWIDRIEEFYGQSDALETLAGVIDKSDIQIMTYFAAQYAARGTITGHGTNSANEADQTAQGGHRGYFMDWISEQIQPAIDWFVDYNFGPQRFYPSLVGSHDQDLTPTVLLDGMIRASAANMLTVDQPIRDSVRSILRQEPEQEREESAPTIKSPVEQDRDLPADPDGGNDRSDGDDNEASFCACGCNRSGGDHSFQAVMDRDSVVQAARNEIKAEQKTGIKLQPKLGGQDQRTGPNGRTLTPLEKLCNWRKIEFAMDSGEKSLTGTLVDARREVANYIVKNTPETWTTPAELAELAQNVKVPASLIKRITRDIKAELDNIARQGGAAIDAEKSKQADSVEFASDEFGDDDPARRVEATRAANEAASDAKEQLVTAAVSIIAPDMTRDQIFDLWDRSIDDFSEAEAKATATMATTNTFAKARQARVDQITESGDPPAKIYYSAVLDANTCVECEEADRLHGESGTAIEPGSAEHVFFMPPFQRCLGGVRCRCILIYEWSN